MKDEDEQPDQPEQASEDELREAAALADALEGRPATQAPAAPPDDALEAAALLHQARAPIAVPPALEPRVMAQVAAALEVRRARGRRRARVWIATSLIAPAAAAAWLLLATVPSRHARMSALPPPAPTADLLAAQAEAIRGGGQAGAALARLDSEMRAYRRAYHERLRRDLGGEP
jgi:hypothetical protein